MTIIWGIICLGFIVFIHELGHFIAARLCGVTVESFSIGMGPVLLHKTIKGTDYRLSLLPFGGYCGMKGEKAFQEALEKNLSAIPAESGSFYGVHPLKRAIIAFSGPGANIIFSVIAFTIIAMVGYTYYSADNRIILADEIYSEIICPARQAGLETGDKIISIDGKLVDTFSDITEIVSTNANKPLETLVIRNGNELKFTLNPIMDTDTGIGKIGVINWIEPIIMEVEPQSPAEQAGLKAGDRILAIDGVPIKNTADIQKKLTENKALSFSISRTLNQDTQIIDDIIIPLTQDKSIGLLFSVPAREATRYSFFPAIFQGFKETGELISLTFKSIGMLFKGLDMTKAVSGPVQITMMLGDTVKTGFSSGLNAGFVSTLNFMALLCVSLFIMNLLPIPILDGGLILFAIIETILRKPVHPKVMYYSQFIGIAFIILLFGIAIFSDANYIISGIKGN
ncbi:MAG: RIP metalloprotease RseP [Spirochaetaceae bacterium]|nr:RIP metalloprotease RseP [Spirochaetaceae bacterium]